MLISGSLSPAAICSSRTETHYLWEEDWIWNCLSGRLSAVRFVPASLQPGLCLGDNISALFPALLPACCSTGDWPGLWRFIILSQGSLIKNPTSPLCAWEIRGSKRRGNVKESQRNYLPSLPLPLGCILYGGGGVSAKQQDNTPPFPFR